MISLMPSILDVTRCLRVSLYSLSVTSLLQAPRDVIFVADVTVEDAKVHHLEELQVVFHHCHHRHPADPLSGAFHLQHAGW